MPQTHEVSAEIADASEGDFASMPGQLTGKHEIKTPWGALHVSISEDAMSAELLNLDIGEPENFQLSAKHLDPELKKLGIVNGFDHSAIALVIDQANNDGGWVGKQRVAKGVLPSGRDYLRFSIEKALDDVVIGQRGWRIGEKKIAFDSIDDLLTSEVSTEVQSSAVYAVAVRKDEVLARVIRDKEKKAGCDVFGRSIDTPGDFPEPGENVIFNEDVEAYIATTDGYLSCSEAQISVRSPIRMAKDQMTAWFVCLPIAGLPHYPRPDELIGTLKAAGVKVGI
ncbi:MAG: hypothetical protein HOH77_11900, partial [Candidatus Latescibacteria bacterium]|nr:hypothetical protein [Candidatus Latescibacterota bacterium]